MDLSLKLLFLISLTNSLLEASQPNPTPSTLKCSHGSLDLQYPFTSKAHRQCQSQNSSSSEFHLLCKDNLPAIKFSSYGELGVKNISYHSKKIDLVDPRNCVHEVFLNLDLSHSHFRYFYLVKNYTYLNCSERLLPSHSFERIPCLSGINHHVYTVENTTTTVDSSCRIIKTVAIPFSYSPYLSDNSFGLGLTWDLPELDQKVPHQIESWPLLVTCLGILTVAMAIGSLIHSARKLAREGSEENGTEENRKLLQSII